MKYSEAYQRQDEHVERLEECYVIKTKWEGSDGWMDSFVAKFFVIVDDGEYVVVKVNGSGVFRQASGGWAKFRILR